MPAGWTRRWYGICRRGRAASGVFVDAPCEEVFETARRYALDTVQLHGEESPAVCAALREAGLRVIKACGVETREDLSAAAAYREVCDALLFDTKSPLRGGTGQRFDWEIPRGIPGDVALSARRRARAGGRFPPGSGGGTSSVPGDRPEQSFRDGSGGKGRGGAARVHGGGAGKGGRSADLPGGRNERQNRQDRKKQERTIKNTKTMNRLEKLFENKGKDILSVYFTAGFPHRDDTVEIIRALADSGVDMIEVGVPFSDPMADGKDDPGQQHGGSAQRDDPRLVARSGGAGAQPVRDSAGADGLSEPDDAVRDRALVPTLQAGGDRCADRPDLPFGEYMEHYKPLCDRYGLPMIMLITPETSPERIRQIDQHLRRIYLHGLCGSHYGYARGISRRSSSTISAGSMRWGWTTIVLIGFGISNPQTFRAACRYSSGAIIGSLFIQALERNPTPEAAVHDLLRTIGRE